MIALVQPLVAYRLPVVPDCEDNADEAKTADDQRLKPLDLRKIVDLLFPSY